ncbi:MAG: hypothetical protein RH917_04740 [Lacipirellulaceae bacterium]
MNKRFAGLLLMLGVFLTLASGCGPTQKREPTTVEQAHLKVLGIMYGKFMSSSRGQAPKNEKELLAYLNANRPSWEKIVGSAEELLISPFNKKPFVIFYGDQFSKHNTDGSLWMAHEQAGDGGQQRAINIRGDVELLDAQQVQQMFP